MLTVGKMKVYLYRDEKGQAKGSLFFLNDAVRRHIKSCVKDCADGAPGELLDRNDSEIAGGVRSQYNCESAGESLAACICKCAAEACSRNNTEIIKNRPVTARRMEEISIYPRVLKDTRGRPFVESDGLYVSASHSGEWVACAVSDRPVGIDIQEERKTDALRILKRFGSPEEVCFLEKEGERAFFEIWCRKEAFSKLVGEGLAYGFGRINTCSEVIADEPGGEYDESGIKAGKSETEVEELCGDFLKPEIDSVDSGNDFPESEIKASETGGDFPETEIKAAEEKSFFLSEEIDGVRIRSGLLAADEKMHFAVAGEGTVTWIMCELSE